MSTIVQIEVNTRTPTSPSELSSPAYRLFPSEAVADAFLLAWLGRHLPNEDRPSLLQRVKDSGYVMLTPTRYSGTFTFSYERL